MPDRPQPDEGGRCCWGSCTTPAAARVRCRNVLGRPTGEAYWLCEGHARRMVAHCPRGDFIEARQAVGRRGR